MDAFADSCKLEEFGFTHAKHAPEGRPPYYPGDLLKLYIYGYLNRIRSSRLLEKECKRNLELMWLLKELTPDHNTIANFRRDNPKAIKLVFRKMVTLCKRLDLRRLMSILGLNGLKQAVQSILSLLVKRIPAIKLFKNPIRYVVSYFSPKTTSYHFSLNICTFIP
ncbi:MAG: transposase [Bacteroidetes bacterium]|nr:transposase [Bacteroidota bacterium]